MGRLNDLLALAHDRARELELSYAGGLLPKDAYEIWQLAPNAKLVDIRTNAELDWVGRIPGAIEIEWFSYPGSQPNGDFLAQLRRQVGNESIVLFICRSGVRSHSAASLATEAGFTQCYNVLEGFEGNIDAKGQRGKLGGWRFADLPWLS